MCGAQPQSSESDSSPLGLAPPLLMLISHEQKCLLWTNTLAYLIGASVLRLCIFNKKREKEKN